MFIFRKREEGGCSGWDAEKNVKEKSYSRIWTCDSSAQPERRSQVVTFQPICHHKMMASWRVLWHFTPAWSKSHRKWAPPDSHRVGGKFHKTRHHFLWRIWLICYYLWLSFWLGATSQIQIRLCGSSFMFITTKKKRDKSHAWACSKLSSWKGFKYTPFPDSKLSMV